MFDKKKLLESALAKVKVLARPVKPVTRGDGGLVGQAGRYLSQGRTNAAPTVKDIGLKNSLVLAFSKTPYGKGVESYQKFTETPYVKNRYIDPVRNLPSNVAKLSVPGQRFEGALGTLGGVATLLPDPIGDIALPAFDALKGFSASSRRGGTLKQNLESAKGALTLEKPVGIGDVFSDDPVAQAVGNIAELPLIIFAGGARGGKSAEKAVLAEIDRLSRLKESGKLTEALSKRLDSLLNLLKDTNAPKDLEPLAQEARNYRSAEEFAGELRNRKEALEKLRAANPGEARIVNAIKNVERKIGAVTPDFYKRALQESNLGKTLKDSETVLHLPEKNVYTRLTEAQADFLKDEVKNIPFTKGDGPHLTQLKRIANAPEGTKAKEVSLEDLQNLSPNAKTALQNFEKQGVKEVPVAAERELASKTKELLAPAQEDLKTASKSTGTTLAQIEKEIYGSATPTRAEFGGEKNGAGFVTDNLRRAQEGVSTAVGRMTESPNKIVRNLGRLFEGFGGGLGKTQERVVRKGQYAGGQEYATKIASDVQIYVNKLLGNNTKSSERVWSVLDPELSKTKIKYESLTPDEKEAVDFLRQVSDFINDTNYKNGFISEALWAKNRGGKYIARAYEVFDFPPEVADYIKQRKGSFDLNPFKQRGDVNDWKEANSIKDPAYLMAKRLQQTLFNDATREMSGWMAKTDLVSDVAKPGFVQLSEHASYGDMSGKWVRKDALEDIKGYFFEHDIAQKAYDLISWYDRNPVRKTYKKLFTIFNPAVRLGNKTGNYVFAWFSGINPVTFTKNKSFAKAEIDGSGQLYRRMLQDGLVGTDITKADIANMASELKRGVMDSGAAGWKEQIKKINESLVTGYGKADDTAKVAAMKTFLDRGLSYEEAARRVYNGFQNYRTVGWLYDIGAKLPILGNPFIRFKADFGRIMKNAVVEHPFRVASTVMAWKLFTDVMSRVTGETEEDKSTRENRFGSPRVPFANVSLAVQTPWGEINAARLLGAYGVNLGDNDVAGDISDFSPIKNPMDARNYATDPVVGPVIATAMDKDFRGKSIKDPNQSKYTGSLLTPQEQLMNQGKFLLRSYSPTVVNSGQDLVSSLQGKPDFYGRTKTPVQSALRIYPGVKVEQFGPEEAQAQRERDAMFEGYRNESVRQKTNAINKQLLNGEITETQAARRIQSLVGESNKKARSFEKSADSPQNTVGLIKLYANGLVIDPVSTVQAMFTDERLRKIRGDAVIFERENYLNPGGTGMEVDHTVSLGLGGDNSPKNLMYYPHETKVQKDRLEKELIAQLESGEIDEKTAQREIRAWVAQNGTGTPYNEVSADYTNKLVEESAKSTSTTYDYLASNGDYKNLSPSIDRVMAMPTTSEIDKAKREKEAYKLTDDILENLAPEDQDSALEDLGISRADAEYYNLASETNDIKTIHVRETISGITDRTELFNKLAEMRREIQGKVILAPGVIDNLVDEEIITKEEGKALKALTTGKDGKTKIKMTGRGKKAKLKAIKFVPLDIPSASTSLPSASGLQLDTPRGFKMPTQAPAVPSLRVSAPASPKYQVRFDL